MNTTKRSLFGWILPTLAVLLTIMALISLAARWFIYDIEQYRETIVSQISETLSLNASIGEIKGRVDFLNPVIYAKQVELSNPETSGQPLFVEQMEIVIDLFASMLYAEPRLRSLRMAGIELDVKTDRENRLLYLPQIARKWNIPQPQFSLGELLNKAIAIDYFDLSFHDVSIHWSDTNIQDTQTFSIVQFTLSPQIYLTQLSLTAELPRTLGRAVTMIASLEHNINNPGGDFYIHVEDLNLNNMERLRGVQSAHQGRLHTELWGRISYRQGLEDLTGTVSLKNYLNPALRLDSELSLDTKLYWKAQKHGRELGFTALSLQSGEAIVENIDLAIIQTQDEDDYFSNLRLYADYISPTIYNQLLSYVQTDFNIEQSRIPNPQNKQFVDLILHTTHSADWFVSPHHWLPVSSPMVMLPSDLPRPLGGQLELTLNNIRLNRGEWTAPQDLEHVELKGSYKGNAEHSEWHLEHLYIKSPDSNLSGNITYRTADNENKHLRSSLQLHHLAATEIMQWVPAQTINPTLERWLHNALRGGSVQYAELAIDGNPDFPFGKNAGLWRLQAQAEDLNLLYRSKDPEIKNLNLDLLLENQSLRIQSNRLQMMGFHADDITVLIDDISLPYVKIDGRGRGPLADILSYVKNTGLVDPDSLLISDIETEGDVDMNLKVHTRLSPTVETETVVEGYIDLNGTHLKLKSTDLDFKQLEGRLHFDRRGGRSDGIDALLNDTYPLTVTAEAADGATRLKMETRMPFPADYLHTLPLAANTFNTALDTWYAELLIPPLRADEQGALQLKLNSNLQATAVNMPAPLHKQVGEAMDTTLLAKITNAGSDYRLDYGNRVRLTLRVPKSGTITGLIHFSPQIAYPHEVEGNSQFVIRGVVPYISVNEWRDWLESYENEAPQPTLYTQDVDVLIEKLVWNASTANQVHIAIKRYQDKTLAEIDSQEVKGNISIPTQADQRVYIDLERLILKGGSLSSDDRTIDPATLPSVAIKIDQLKIGNHDMENLKIALAPEPDGVQITQMSFSKKDNDKILMQAQLEGDWKKVAEQDRSRFKFLLYSDDYGLLMRNWDFYSGFKGGQGTINGQLQWADTPSNFEPGKLQGTVKLQIKDGAIETIEPGIGRLFGLMNIDALARRLTLDFKDVFDKGFEFDNMQGALEFDKANLITKNLDINGPALDMKIEGRTGITARDYDQKIIVTPHVGTNVALATAFLGGPLTAATVFLLSRVTELDNLVDKIITLEYTLKGSWDQPKVEFISAPIAQKLDPMNTIKTPSRHIKNLLDKIFPGKTK